MNLRKTIAGAAVALGSTAVMLGLGGVAQAAEVGAEARPSLDTEPGELAGVGDVVRLDTNDLADHVRALDLRLTDPAALAANLRGPVGSILRDKAGHVVPNVETGIGLGS
jgi:hypothetical protein